MLAWFARAVLWLKHLTATSRVAMQCSQRTNMAAFPCCRQIATRRKAAVFMRWVQHSNNTRTPADTTNIIAAGRT